MEKISDSFPFLPATPVGYTKQCDETLQEMCIRDSNYELYKVFFYVAQSLSFSEASKHLYISQSAVSQSIKTLERKLGQPLFIRSTKKVQLTPAGQLLLKHVEPAMNLIRRGENQLFDSQGLGLGQLHIGASDTICRYFLVPYFRKFHQQYPNVPIKVTNATSLNCVDLLEQGKVDPVSYTHLDVYKRQEPDHPPK